MKLKFCPFCGHNELQVNTNYEKKIAGGLAQASVHCFKCGAIGPTTNLWFEDLDGTAEEMIQKAEDYASESWNERKNFEVKNKEIKWK